MRYVIAANSLGSFAGFLFALIDEPGTLPAGLAMIAAGAVLAAGSLARGERGEIVAVARRPGVWLIAAIIGIETSAIASAVSYTTLVVVAFLTQLAPVVTVALAPLFGERVTRDDLWALVLAVLAGTLFALDRSGGDARSHLIGVALSVVGLVGVGVVFHLQRAHAVDAMPPLPAQSVTLFLAGCAVVPFGGGLPGFSGSQYLLVGAIAAIFAVTNVLLFRALREVRASQVAVARPFGVLVATVLGTVVLSQAVTVTSVVAGVTALAAVAVAIVQPSARVRRAGALPALPRRAKCLDRDDRRGE